MAYPGRAGRARSGRGCAPGARPLRWGAQGFHSLKPGPIAVASPAAECAACHGSRAPAARVRSHAVASTHKHKGHPPPLAHPPPRWSQHFPSHLLACGLAGPSPLQRHGGAPRGPALVPCSISSPGVVAREHPSRRRPPVRVQVCCGCGGGGGGGAEGRGVGEMGVATHAWGVCSTLRPCAPHRGAPQRPSVRRAQIEVTGGLYSAPASNTSRAQCARAARHSAPCEHVPQPRAACCPPARCRVQHTARRAISP